MFAAAPAKPGAIKDDLMVKVQAAAAADRAALADEIEARGRQAAAKLERYERLADALGDPDGADLGPQPHARPRHRVRARDGGLVRAGRARACGPRGR